MGRWSFERFLKIAPWAVVCVVLGASLACGRADSELRAEVQTKLANDAVTAPLGLKVDVRRRVVYLSGETTTRAEQQRATEIARSVDGVSDVMSEMRINDQVIVDAVKRALASDPMVASIPIDVDSDRGFVRLMSDKTTRPERERAVALAKAVDGVTEVQDRMR
jgi:osmotically-inducible protein OsmY